MPCPFNRIVTTGHASSAHPIRSREGKPLAVISVVNAKGGSGKSTAALVLGLGLAEAGARVVLLDADPNMPLSRWAADRKGPVTVIGGITDSSLVPTIDRCTGDFDAIIVDVEGVAGRMAGRAVGRSDLTIIPLNATALDAIEAYRTIGLVTEESQIHRRSIPYRLMLSRSSKIATRDERAIIKELDRKGIPRLHTSLVSRVAFAALFSKCQTLAEMKATEVSGIEQARENAKAFADEITLILRTLVAREAA